MFAQKSQFQSFRLFFVFSVVFCLDCLVAVLVGFFCGSLLFFCCVVFFVCCLLAGM